MKQGVVELGDRLIVELAGEVDLSNASALRRLLLECTDRRMSVLVDMALVDYIDSSGIACLIEALQRSNKVGGGFALSSIAPNVMRIFKLARLEKVFEIFADRASALAEEW